MKKPITFTIIAVIILALGGWYIFTHQKLATTIVPNENLAVKDYKNIAYTIDDSSVTLTNGVSEMEAAPGSASKITTTYFGNEIRKDVDGDGSEDVVFLLTQNSGGSGTFYYVVAALNTPNGYVGTSAFLLGDRIAPQTTESGQGKSVVVNYADRAPGQPFTVAPSVGKTAHIILNPQTNEFVRVEDVVQYEVQ